MPEPTIDEMLESLKHTNNHWGIGHYKAIRAILEQHRSAPAIGTRFDFRHMQQVELEAIRAFLKRASLRIDDSSTSLPFFAAVHEELAAMEKESNG